MPAQSDARFTLNVTDAPFDVVEFELIEGLSEQYSLRLKLVSSDPAIDFSKVLDRHALFTIWRNEVPVRHVHGLVSHFEQGETGFRKTYYRAVVEPGLARLALGSDWRIFQVETVPQIIARVLKEQHILHYETIDTTEHLTREYCVQAGDTHAYFLERIAREEGYFHGFLHTAEKHTLIYCDRLWIYGSIEGGPVAYNPIPGGDQPEPALRRFRYAENVRTARQTQRDYTFTHPRYHQEHSLLADDLDHQFDHYERFDYPGRYKRDAAGKPFSLNRLRGHRRDARVAEVEGDDARLQPGLAFDLIGHPRDAWNRGWRVIRMCHRGVQHTSLEEDGVGAEQGTHYSYTAELVPDDVEWRPEPLPKPRIDGPQIATVVGPGNEEVYVDEWGRVKVQFPWDRRGQNDDRSSCWLRVAQAWAGTRWGAVMLPRVGQEVVVAFLDGDADQAVVIARTFREANRPPYQLPHCKWLATIHSKEIGNGWRASELRFDDTPREISAALTNDHGKSALHLGYLTHPRPDGGQPRGEGFELRTDQHGAVRAGQGLLLTTEPQPDAQGGQLNRDDIIRQLEAALELARKLGNYAGEHQGLAHDAQPQQRLTDAVRDLGHGANDEKGSGGGAPVVAISAPAGMANATPQSITLAAGKHVDGIARENVQFTSGGQTTVNAGAGIGLFTHGGDLRAIAHQGLVALQAQHNAMLLQADTSVEVSAARDHVQISAEKYITLLCGGAYIKIGGGNIEFVAPGAITSRAGQHIATGPGSASVHMLAATMTPFALSPLSGECAHWRAGDSTAPASASPSAAPAVAGAEALRQDAHIPMSPPAAAGVAQHADLPPIPSSGIKPPNVDLPVPPKPADLEQHIRPPIKLQPPVPCNFNPKAFSNITWQPAMATKAYYGMVNETTPMLLSTGEPRLVSGGGHRKFEMTYDVEKRTLTAAVRIEVELLDLHRVNSFTGQPIPGSNGQPESVPYATDKNGANAENVDPTLRAFPRTQTTWDVNAEAARIEATLNQNNYQLIVDGCEQGGACGCRVTVKFRVTLYFKGTTGMGTPHERIRLFPKMERADAMTWGEERVWIDEQTDAYHPLAPAQVNAHEAGHLFNWPDEYYKRGGSVHGQYVDDTRHLNFALGQQFKGQPTWQLESPDTVMGYGAGKATATMPPYYLNSICRWFSDRTGHPWRVGV